MKKTIALLLTLILCMGLLMGCEEDDGKTGSQTVANTSALKEQDATETSQQKLNAKQPTYFPDYSLERENINKKNKMFSDPNRIGYIYELSFGVVVNFYDVKGKVTNNSSQLTNTSQIIKNNAYQGYAYTALESPQPDGTYGTSGDGIFWFDTKGLYHEWKGDYEYSSEPHKLNSTPLVAK